MTLPLFDCRIDTAGASALSQILASGALAAGMHTEALEREISRYLGGRDTVAMSNMTLALELALKLAGVRPGDEVLTLSFNCLSSNSAIHNVGAKPVWIDIDPATASMDIDDARAKLTSQSRALVVYHVAGYPSNVSALRTLCDEARICLIEDANAAFGTQLPGGAAVGTIGDFAVFSFYANRQINAIEGAALICPNKELAARAKRLRRYGIDQNTFRDARGEIDPQADVPEIGFAAALSNVNAILALESLKTFVQRLAVVRDNVEALVAALANVPGINIVRPVPGGIPANWVLLLLTEDRESVMAALRTKGVGCGKLHQPNHVYSGFATTSRFLRGTDIYAKKMFAVPCGWWVDEYGRKKIVDAISLGLASCS